MSSLSIRGVASFEVGVMTRATTRASNVLDKVPGAAANESAAPQASALPRTAATWPCGRPRSTVKTSSPLGIRHAPLEENPEAFDNLGGKTRQVGEGALLDLARLAKQDGRPRVASQDGLDVNGMNDV